MGQRHSDSYFKMVAHFWSFFLAHNTMMYTTEVCQQIDMAEVA